MFLGHWDSEMRAALVHDVAYYKLRGDFSRCNVKPIRLTVVQALTEMHAFMLCT